MDMSTAEVKRAAQAQPQPPHQDPNGSEILVRCLQAEGVKFLWGYPGGAVLYIYDALYKQDTSSTFWSVTSRLPCTRPMATRAPPEKSG